MKKVITILILVSLCLPVVVMAEDDDPGLPFAPVTTTTK